MSRILSVTGDENLINTINQKVKNENYKLFFTDKSDEAHSIIKDNDIVVAIIDYDTLKERAVNLCEEVIEANSDVGIILVFNHSDTIDVLGLYNRLNIYGLICKGFVDYNELPGMIHSYISEYYRFRNDDDSGVDYNQLRDLYLKPMQEMSSILNERLLGYSNITDIFRKCFGFVINTSDAPLKAIEAFVDRIINDYINIFMTREPDINAYLARILKNCNKEQEKKYFKIDGEITDLSKDVGCNVLFVIVVITSCFEVFYPHYRGKISIVNSNSCVELNTIYEVRKNHDFKNIYKYIMSIVNNIVNEYSSGVKNGVKDNIIQYRVLFNV